MAPGESTPMLPTEGPPKTPYTVGLGFLFPALGGMLYGYDIGGTSSIVESVGEIVTLSAVATSLLTSAALFGSVIASASLIWLADILGRRRCLLLGTLCYAVGSLWAILAPDGVLYAWLFLGKFIYGMGIAYAMNGAPAYIAEIAPAHIRGTLIALKEAFIVGGMLLGYVVALLADPLPDDDQWRVVQAVALPVAILVGLGVWRLPPSPRWLVSRGRRAEAIEALRFYRGGAGAELDPGFQKALEAEADSIAATLPPSKGEGFICCDTDKWRGLCTVPRALATGLGLVVFQQVTGQPTVLYYAQSIFSAAGMGGTEAKMNDIIVAAAKLIATVASGMLVERAGRKILLFSGISMMFVALVPLGIAYMGLSADVTTLVGVWPAVTVCALILYVAGYQFGFGPITWLLVSEGFPLEYRSLAMAAANTTNFALNLIMTFIDAPLVELLGQSVLFFAFAVLCVVSFVYIALIVPETKGLTLEQIDKIMRLPVFGGGSSPPPSPA